MRNTAGLILAAALLLVLGCSKSSTHTATNADGNKVTLASKGDQVTMDVTTKSGEKVSLQSSATGMSLPKDFAPDVPIHPKGVVKIYNQVGKGHTQVGILAPLPVAEIVTYYETELKKQGWSAEPTMKMGEGAMMTPKKDQRTISLIITPQDPKTTYVQMVITTTGA